MIYFNTSFVEGWKTFGKREMTFSDKSVNYIKDDFKATLILSDVCKVCDPCTTELDDVCDVCKSHMSADSVKKWREEAKILENRPKMKRAEAKEFLGITDEIDFKEPLPYDVSQFRVNFGEQTSKMTLAKVMHRSKDFK